MDKNDVSRSTVGQVVEWTFNGSITPCSSTVVHMGDEIRLIGEWIDGGHIHILRVGVCRDTPVTLDRAQHPFTRGQVRKVAGRLESRKFEIDRGVDVRTPQPVLRYHHAEGQVVTDHRFHSAAIPERVLLGCSVPVNT